jgi:hypothetical protein
MVPFVKGLALLHAVIALQASKRSYQNLGQGFGQLGFANAGFHASEEERAFSIYEAQKNGGDVPAVPAE